MEANEKRIYNLLKTNPALLSEVAEIMGDALCLLLIETETVNDFEIRNVIIQLARTRLDVRKLVTE